METCHLLNIWVHVYRYGYACCSIAVCLSKQQCIVPWLPHNNFLLTAVVVLSTLVEVSASIYMITRYACVRVYVRPSVTGCPEARRGVPIDLKRHKVRAHCGRAVISQGQQQLQGHDRSNSMSRRAWLGRGDRGWATTELRLNNYNYRSKPGPGLRRTAV